MAREFAKTFYKSKEWEQVREYCLKRDHYMCTTPGCYNPAEEVHHVIHLDAENVNDPKISLNPGNLVSLCRACHFEAHRGEHGQGRKAHEADNNPYRFDENGYIVRDR